MAISANTLGQTATTLMQQLDNNIISFQSFRDSVNSIISSANNNPDFNDSNNTVAIHTVSIAIRTAQGDDPTTGKIRVKR